MNNQWKKRFSDVHIFYLSTNTWKSIDCTSLTRSIETFKNIAIFGNYALLINGIDEMIWIFNLGKFDQLFLKPSSSIT